MSEELGPGAGRTSAPEIAVVTERIAALDRHVTSEFGALKELLASQREDDQKAIATALTASQELAAKHNDLIRQQEKKDATYATKDEVTALVRAQGRDIDRLSSWQARLGGGLLVLGFIGIANLIKLWTG